jgi:hypothetical protein
LTAPIWLQADSMPRIDSAGRQAELNKSPASSPSMRRQGRPDAVLELEKLPLELREVPKPAAGPGELLVRVHAAAVNARDWHIMRGDPYIVRLILSGGGTSRGRTLFEPMGHIMLRHAHPLAS